MTVNDTITYYIQRQLNEPPPAPPGRHKRLMSLSFQMVGEGIPDETIFRLLREWFPDQDITDREIRDLIKGAMRGIRHQPGNGATHLEMARAKPGSNRLAQATEASSCQPG
jgi:hypothetical protein